MACINCAWPYHNFSSYINKLRYLRRPRQHKSESNRRGDCPAWTERHRASPASVHCCNPRTSRWAAVVSVWLLPQSRPSTWDLLYCTAITKQAPVLEIYYTAQQSSNKPQYLRFVILHSNHQTQHFHMPITIHSLSAYQLAMRCGVYTARLIDWWIGWV